MGHMHHEWLLDASEDIQKEYDRLFSKAAEPGRTQEVGHQNESLWADFLTQWLPLQYQVETRKYIIGTRDSENPPFETDLVVFNPGYPSKLRDKSHVMAGGVAAAFSTKLTIKSAGLKEAARDSASLCRSVVMERGHARLELWKPYVFGVLAASHGWKRDNSTPAENMANQLYENDLAEAMHPAESLDLICVANLGTWTKMATFVQDPANLVEGEIVLTSHAQISAEKVTPLALFLSALYGMMSWRNGDMSAIAHDFRRTGGNISGTGFGRSWNAGAVLSDEARLNLRGRPFSDANGLDSPMQGNFMWQ